MEKFEHFFMLFLYNILGLGLVCIGTWHFFDRPTAFLAVLICLCTEILLLRQQKILRLLTRNDDSENDDDAE